MRRSAGRNGDALGGLRSGLRRRSHESEITMLLGKRNECDALEGLLDGVRALRSDVQVVGGNPPVGESRSVTEM
jgi:hypothetical protein